MTVTLLWINCATCRTRTWICQVRPPPALRTGWPEVVFGKGKSPKQVATIVKAFKDRGHPVLGTKTNQEAYLAVLKDTPEAEFHQLPAAIVVPTPNTTVATQAL
ncbi:MAG: hypothetical protein CM1200mP22_15940 [Dehalococcoidia bacterium]|nr:MAG: hypothetical protein CM1200mP22_15940 [Dehalococcoidia bacterium]